MPGGGATGPAAGNANTAHEKAGKDDFAIVHPGFLSLSAARQRARQALFDERLYLIDAACQKGVGYQP